MLEEKPKNRLGKPRTPSDTTSGGGATTASTRQPLAADPATSGPIHPASIHDRARIVQSPVDLPKPVAEPPVVEPPVVEPPGVETAAVETAAVETAAVETAAVETAAVETAAVETAAVEAGAGRAGRNLPMAIAVGVGLGGAIIISLAVYQPAFLAIVLAAVLVSVWELTRALRSVRVRPALVPLILGSVAMVVVTWLSGPSGLAVTTMLTVLAVLVWRLSDGPVGYFRDASSAVLITVYVPLLACFAVLMLRPDDGVTRIVAFILTVVCSDVGGYVAGVLFGKHPMSPTVSPKKSWEGLGGSVVACMIVGVLMVGLALDGSWWQGILYGAAIAVTATLGDLGESIVKRDLGIKDMGNLLPGHGGLMDRMDSLLPSAAVAYLLLTAFLPPALS